MIDPGRVAVRHISDCWNEGGCHCDELAAAVRGTLAAQVALAQAVADLPEWHCVPCVSAPGDHGNVERAAVLRLIEDAGQTAKP